MKKRDGKARSGRCNQTDFPGLGFLTYLCIPVIGFFELHVCAGLAAQVQPLSLHPFHGGFLDQGARVDLSDEDQILACRRQTGSQECQDVSARTTAVGSTHLLAGLTCDGGHMIWRLLQEEPDELCRL